MGIGKETEVRFVSVDSANSSTDFALCYSSLNQVGVCGQHGTAAARHWQTDMWIAVDVRRLCGSEQHDILFRIYFSIY
jgi:hypothetical protein